MVFLRSLPHIVVVLLNRYLISLNVSNPGYMPHVTGPVDTS